MGRILIVQFKEREKRNISALSFLRFPETKANENTQFLCDQIQPYWGSTQTSVRAVLKANIIITDHVFRQPTHFHLVISNSGDYQTHSI